MGQYPMKYYWTRWLPDGAYFTTFPFLRDQTMAPTLDYYTYYDALLPQYFAVNQAEKVGDVATAWLVFWGEESDTVQRLEQAGYVRSTRIPTDHLGNQIELLRYDYLPEGRRATYQNNMVLRAVEIHPDTLRVDLWWSADGPIVHNYTTSVMLLDANGFPVAQKDNPPPVPTTAWQPDDVIYDSKQMTLLHDDLPPGEYQIIVKVYLWSPDAIEDIPTIDGDPWAVVGTLNHHSLAKQ